MQRRVRRSVNQQTRRVRFRTKIAPKTCGTASEPLEYYEVSCRINYGDLQRVQVEFQSSGRKSCSFVWRKRRLRKSISSDEENLADETVNNRHDFCGRPTDLRTDSEREFCVQSTDCGCFATRRCKNEKIMHSYDNYCAENSNEFKGFQCEENNDHNRILDSTQSLSCTPPTSASDATTKNGRKSEPEAELQALGFNNNNNNHINTATTGDKQQLPVTTYSRSSSQSSPPPPTSSQQQQQQQQHAKKIATGGTQLLEKKSQMKLPTTTRKFLQQKQAQQQLATPTDAHGKIFSNSNTPTSGEYLDAVELQQLKLLNRHSCNGRLDYESIERHLQQAQLKQQQQDKGVAALGVLLNYLVHELDAFSCPALKHENIKLKDELRNIVQQLDEARNESNELQHQLCDKEAYYTQREEELQALHRCELDKAKENLCEIELMAKKRIEELEQELAAKNEQHKRDLDSYQYEMETKLAERQKELTATEERLKSLTKSETELKSQLAATEQNHAQQLDASLAREETALERIKLLNKELDKLRETKQHRERELRDKLNLTQDEIALLRSSQRNHGENMPSMRHSSASCTSASNSGPLSELSRLQSEADSLRCVLELKQMEISKLNKQNEELMRDAEERSVLRVKISSLESHREMLQSELNIKIEKEKEITRQLDDMQKKLKHEGQKRTRLSYDNEALSWQLKQRSEQLHILQTKFQESFKDHSSSLDMLNCSSLANGSHSQHLSSMSENGSPPASPIIKGVIEKNDSVSWVLEMDDETPEAAASKIVKRVGSFRSVERSPSQRRQLSVSSGCGSSALSSSSPISGSGGPHPLSQSMSATSVIRQHSNDSVHSQPQLPARVRSQSVSHKSPEPGPAEVSQKSNKKLVRQNSMGTTRKLDVGSPWKEPNSSSSPYAGVRPRSSTLKSTNNCPEDLFFRQPVANATRKLITCDTSTLNSGERLELRSLPTHPSVHELKSRKKCLEIQESAGEAMVSGTNSEDEGCSASSDDIASSVSTSSAHSSSSSSLNHIKNSNMSLEEVLLLEKINSLNGTPMECSWSDDAEIYAGPGGV